MTATLATTASIATELNTTPRELRKFLRSQAKGVGKGSRYALPATKTAITKMRKEFDAWGAQVEAKTAAKRASKVEVDESTDDADEIDMTDELADDELDALDDSIDD